MNRFSHPEIYAAVAKSAGALKTIECPKCSGGGEVCPDKEKKEYPVLCPLCNGVGKLIAGGRNNVLRRLDAEVANDEWEYMHEALAEGATTRKALAKRYGVSTATLKKFLDGVYFPDRP